MKDRQAIRRRVLRGIALNRTPGFHFPGNFLDISFDRVARDRSRLSFASGPWCLQADGSVDLGALAMLADLGLAACIRANLSRETRLATVSMHLQFTGAPAVGRLRADGEFQGFFLEGASRLGMSRVAVAGGKGTVCYGTGTFMALRPPNNVTLHPVPHRGRNAAEPRRLKESELDGPERDIVRRADAALAAPGPFIRNFWGSDAVLENGLHAGNRVGHAQGGILVGMAAANAARALPGGWKLSGVTAMYVSPGEGRRLRAVSRIIHQGRLTAVVRTRITGRNRRRVLDVVSAHCAGA